jgi:hypothetical protein
MRRIHITIAGGDFKEDDPARTNVANRRVK